MEAPYSTTIHCSIKERELIKSSAQKRGLTVLNFVNVAIKNHIPIKEIRHFDQAINRTETKIGAQIPDDLYELVVTNKELLNSPFQKVAMYHVVLTAVLMECEG